MATQSNNILHRLCPQLPLQRQVRYTFLLQLSRPIFQLLVATLLGRCTRAVLQTGDFAALMRNIEVLLLTSFLYYGIRIPLENRTVVAKNRNFLQAKILLAQTFLYGSKLETLNQTPSSAIYVRLREDWEQLWEYDQVLFPQNLVAALSVIAYAAIFLRESWLLFICFLLLASLQGIPAVFLRNRFEDAYLHMQTVEENETDWILQAHSGYSTLKLFGAISWYFRKKLDWDKEYIRHGFHADALVSFEEAVTSLIEAVIRIASYALIALLILRRVLSYDRAVEALVLAGSFFALVQSLFAFVPQYSRKRASQKRLQALFQDVLEAGKQEFHRLEKPKGGAGATLQSTSTAFSSSNPEGVELQIQNLVFSYSEQLPTGKAETKQQDKSAKPPFSAPKSRSLLQIGALHLQAGEKLLVTGPNGCGKSTLLKLLAGVLTPDEGRIWVQDSEPRTWEDEERKAMLGYLPQSEEEPDLSVREFLEQYFSPQEGALVGLRLEAFGVEPAFYERSIPALSGGERKKLQLAILLAGTQPLLLLDEPTNDLDREGVEILIQCLQTSSQTVVLVTHDPRLYESCDRRLVLDSWGRGIERRKGEGCPESPVFLRPEVDCEA